MQYTVLCVGRRAQDPLLDAADRYEARLRSYARLAVERLREAGAAAEGRQLLARLPPACCVVALDERGTQHSTASLGAWLTARAAAGTGRVAFVIGGADGLAPPVHARADASLALSRLTLPHRLALVLLLEQLYRVHTVWRGEPYHRAAQLGTQMP